MYYLNFSNVSTPKDYVLREESVKYKANDRLLTSTNFSD